MKTSEQKTRLRELADELVRLETNPAMALIFITKEKGLLNRKISPNHD